MNEPIYRDHDDFAPNPRASRVAAAKKRERAQQGNGEVLSPSPLTPAQIAMGVLGILVALGLLSLFLARPSAPLVLPTPTVATVPAPAAVAAPTPPPTFIASAYAAPDGAVLGPVDLDGEVTMAVARYGDGWVQLERGDRTRVWFRRADLPPNLAVGGGLPDLAPPPPQTGRGMGEEGSAPASAPAPSYIDNVGAQAPHSPRGDVVETAAPQAEPVPTSIVLDLSATVPPLSDAQATVIGAQAPHKIR